MPRMTSTALRDENKVGIKHVNKNALSRLLKIIFSDHRGALIVVMVCILITVFTNVANSMFLSTLIDDYITPMLASGQPGLLRSGPCHCHYDRHLCCRYSGFLYLSAADGLCDPGHHEEDP